MAFWNSQGLETLKEENEKLLLTIKYLEKDCKLTDTYMELNKKYNLKFLDCQSANLKVEELEKEIEMLKAKLCSSVPLTEHEQIVEFYKTQNTGLKNTIERLKNTPSKIHNARGAGRKSRITPDNIVFTKQALSQGKGLTEIAKLLSQVDGKPWSKSTVKYMIVRYIKTVSEMEELND